MFRIGVSNALAAVFVILAFVIGAAVSYGVTSTGLGTATITQTQTTTAARPTELPICITVFYSSYNAISLQPIPGQSNSIMVQHLGSNPITVLLYHFENQQWQSAAQIVPGASFAIPLPNQIALAGAASSNLSLQVNSHPFSILVPLPFGNCVPVGNIRLSSNIAIDQKQFLANLLNKLADEAQNKSLRVAGKLLEVFDNMSRILRDMAKTTLPRQNGSLCSTPVMNFFTSGFYETAKPKILNAYLTVCDEYRIIGQSTNVSLEDLNKLMWDLVELDNIISSDP